MNLLVEAGLDIFFRCHIYSCIKSGNRRSDRQMNFLGDAHTDAAAAMPLGIGK